MKGKILCTPYPATQTSYRCALSTENRQLSWPNSSGGITKRKLKQRIIKEVNKDELIIEERKREKCREKREGSLMENDEKEKKKKIRTGGLLPFRG